MIGYWRGAGACVGDLSCTENQVEQALACNELKLATARCPAFLTNPALLSAPTRDGLHESLEQRVALCFHDEFSAIVRCLRLL